MTNKGIKFDPGFSPYVLAFSGTLAYIYQDISRFSNLSQKKIKFMQYHKKMIELFDNNIGFYIGCLMWAAYIKSLPEQEIIENPCYAKEYDEEENTFETQYLLKFTELFPKDMKYYLNKPYSFKNDEIKLINVYEKFLTINKGFTETKTNKNVILPEEVNCLNVDEYKTLIETAISNKNLAELKQYLSQIIK